MVVILVLQPGERGDSLGAILLYLFVLTIEAILFVPFSLAVTAELVQRQVLARRFMWSKALTRFLLGLSIAAGPVYRPLLWLHPLGRAHGAEKEVLFYSISAIFAFLALKIRRPGASVVSTA
jgi:hypothetical protein